MSLPLIEPLLPAARVIPVLVLDDPDTAVSVAGALLAGGLSVLEVTLRTPAALTCAEAIAKRYPDALVGLGTLTRPEDFPRARDAGARFLVSPGLTPRVAEAALDCGLPYLPGIATVGEAMAAREYGFHELKFFPAVLNGGVPALKGMAPLLQDVRFCPTGGLTAASVPEVLSLPNVFALGGSWLTPATAVKDGRWDEIEALARAAVAASVPAA
ncbi:MAG: bifunctional 4-hydroxy-2-oxoglutarate aldolase/2-dehydro-3-deoxy-phosphogluconate aldolase [Rhodospirillum sp.]|nr:bifunctional 4-hydroxy-2-oxoglutarate aldolase/2-dehydro-3-deoxy-phosphogluconate aldolase [Rhodospirillum sp.]MCF8490761.1 bifunctional 4-hydroxy-2-oxoglutarate aldolase/2-dehydro-3-deoxy-phosphogluconate aldolase [Rhodospirillum sp.]MCF8502248.1 bifunctional 4-hydroxy-2-oxoglutarate aldolase/2-dehydro-3-deoxy-phosphogluconate aldolase [Rhodospirillum sp.]